MRVYAGKGLHHGVFQGLDGSICKHEFYTNSWNEEEKPKPNNVFILTEEQKNSPQDSFFDIILVQSIEDYQLISRINKPILYYDLCNGRGTGPKFIYDNPNVVPMFISNGCKTSHGIYGGFCKSISQGVDGEFFNGWTGEEKRLVIAKNNFKERDINKFNLFNEVCSGYDSLILGSGQQKSLGYKDLADLFRKSRVYMNIEIENSGFDTACIEAMMTGMPIISTDTEVSGQFIRDGIEGFISNNVDYLKKRVRDLLNDWDMAKKLGDNARKMAEVQFSKENFNIQWNELLNNIEYYRR